MTRINGTPPDSCPVFLVLLLGSILGAPGGRAGSAMANLVAGANNMAHCAGPGEKSFGGCR